ncbi:Vinculin/alpha-catenin [Rhizoclosmatium globosum]|uniref:Vinculin/alpha-catenin n=1 Tax=Rhizoclosmatium globosum TaxID=329046 RepID=A0A1Y2CY81_9FUNG|nr:Vinculin/alpha-catenin [Rhizoclosmatium globosum]|eukprot:ORY51970.1 Vinculin/alpha-catenin [Rhizoclosmatium globosum]
MYSKTAKTVLAPLADAVSSLVLIFAEAELSRTPMADLTSLAHIVDDQIAHLTAIGLKVSAQAASTDTQLKEEMPDACRKVKVSSELLVTATSTIAKDPHSSIGRSDLIDGVKGILQNTTKILSIMDDLEVRRLLTGLVVVRNHVTSLKDQEALIEEDTRPPAIVKWEALWVQTIALYSQALSGFLQQCHKRIAELIDQKLQTRLQSAAQVLSRESPVFVSTCRVVVSRIGPVQAKGMFKMTLIRMIAALDDIEGIISTRLDEEFNKDLSTKSHTMKLDQGEVQNMDDFITEVKNVFVTKAGNPHAAMNDFSNLSANILSSTKRFMNLVSDATQRAEISSQLEEIQKTDNEILSSARGFLSKPDSVYAQQELGQKLGQSRTCHAILRFIKNRMIVSELSSSNISLLDYKTPITVLGAVVDAAEKGNRPKLTNALQSFESETSRWLSLCASGMELCPFPDHQSAIDTAHCVRTTQALVPALIASANLLSVNPGEETAVKHLERICRSWVENLQGGVTLARNNFTPFEIISGLYHCFGQHVKAMGEAIAKGDVDVGLVEAFAAMASANQFSAAAKRVYDSAGDLVYRNSIESRCQDMDRALPIFVARIKHLLECKSFKEAGDLMSFAKDVSVRFLAIEDIMKVRNESLINLGNIGDVIANEEKEKELIVEGISVQILETASDTCVIDGEPPRPMTEYEAKHDPIQAAAQDILVEASNWSMKDNPIIESSIRISEQLSILARFFGFVNRETGNAEAKKEFILASKTIHVEALKISGAVKPIVERCMDKQLAKQLQGSIQWVENLAQQLKIVIAVKTSAPSDASSDVQLIACAKNLMVAVKGCIRDSEAGSLRVITNVEPSKERKEAVSAKRTRSIKKDIPLAPIVKFRRNVYRRTGTLR